MTNTAQLNIQVQRIVVVVSVVLFAAKVLAYFLTHSVAILTDALESTVNVITGFTGLYTLHISAQPRDENHPYGHGKAELVSATFEGLLILIAGLIIIYESIQNLLDPHPIKQLDYGMLLISATAAINYALGWYCIRTGKKNHSIALRASGKHLQSDTWTTVGIVVGLGLILLTNVQWIDSVAAIVFGTLIIVEGYKILRETIAGITDEADAGLLREVIVVLNEQKHANWIDMHNLRIIKFGSLLHLDCHLTVPWYFNVHQAHKEVEGLEQLISDHFPQSLEMFVHTDGCLPPQSCRVCPVQDCPHRQRPFEERLEWTYANITANQKHG